MWLDHTLCDHYLTDTQFNTEVRTISSNVDARRDAFITFAIGHEQWRIKNTFCLVKCVIRLVGRNSKHISLSP